jgi:hypothetical protein
MAFINDGWWNDYFENMSNYKEPNTKRQKKFNSQITKTTALRIFSLFGVLEARRNGGLPRKYYQYYQYFNTFPPHLRMLRPRGGKEDRDSSMANCFQSWQVTRCAMKNYFEHVA